MKIGVDARLLSRPITGIGRYTIEMCRALSHIDDVSLYLYSPAPLNSDITDIFGASDIKTCFSNNRLFRQYWAEFILPKWARQDNLDVFWGPAHRLPRNLLAHMARVVTIHDLVYKYAGHTMRPLSKLLECYQVPAAIKKAHHIVAVSQATASAVMNEFKVEAEQLTVITLGSNHMRPDVNANPLKTYCLFVGTLEPRKNLENLLIAYAKLPRMVRQKAPLIIAGGAGWGDVNLKEIIYTLHLSDDVKLLGYVAEDKLTELYTHAQFLAMPSLYEGFGLPLIEAMMCGTPVLTSNNSSMIEVTGNAGILVDPFDIDSITNGLNELITNDQLRENLTLNAKIQADRFNWQVSANKLVQVFKQAMTQ